MSHFILVVGTILVFGFSSACVYFLPRAIAGVSLFGLVIGKSDLGVLVGLPSVYGAGGDKNIVVAALTVIFYLWIVPGCFDDLAQCKNRWHCALMHLKSVF